MARMNGAALAIDIAFILRL